LLVLIVINFNCWFFELYDVKQGLLPAIDKLLAGVEQRFCVRHFYNNFRKRFPGKKLKELMWRAAKATYRNAFEREMMEIKKLSEEAFKYLCEIEPRHWTRAMFKGDTKCDTLVNNISEAFNSVIVVPRSKPIVSMLEDIRVYMMERWQINREKIAKYAHGEVLPNIKKKLEKESSYTNNWLVRYEYNDKQSLISIHMLIFIVYNHMLNLNVGKVEIMISKLYICQTLETSMLSTCWTKCVIAGNGC